MEPTIWQIACGDHGRDYTSVFLEHDLMFVGPGHLGSFSTEDYASLVPSSMSRQKLGALRSFCSDVRPGDLVLLRRVRGTFIPIHAANRNKCTPHHDPAVVRHMSNRIAVTYAGKIVEYGNYESIYERTLHPHTKALISAALPSSPDTSSEEIVLPREVPSPFSPPSAATFSPAVSMPRISVRSRNPHSKAPIPTMRWPAICGKNYPLDD